MYILFKSIQIIFQNFTFRLALYYFTRLPLNLRSVFEKALIVVLFAQEFRLSLNQLERARQLSFSLILS